MKSIKKFWIGPLMAASILLTALSAAQTFPTLKGDNARTGRNATPAISNPGRGFLTWFRPNANDPISGSIMRNNTAQAPANVNFTPGFLPAPFNNAASFAFDWPSFGDQASDLATGGFAVYPLVPFDGRNPSYHYANTVGTTSTQDPTIGATQTFTWIMDPTAPPISQPGTGPQFARNYALSVWLPIGSTFTAGGRQYTQRYWVYQINYGPGASQVYTEIIDTYAAGAGWVRLGNAGNDSNRMFQYDGTNPIRITLFNTVPIDVNTNQLTDNPLISLVYADAAMAVPQVGTMVATPTVSYLTGSAQGRAIAAVNRLSVGLREGQTTTISQGEVKSYNYANGSIDTALTGVRWTFRPADQRFTVTMDNTAATVSGPWVTNPVGPGSASALGPNYLTSILVPAPATAAAEYAPALEDGQYEIQMYLSPDTATQLFGTSVRVEVHEGATVTPINIDMNRGPGWFTISNTRFNHINTTAPLRFVVTNEGTPNGTHNAFADAVRFIGAFDSEINSTPTSARVFIRQNGGALVEQDVVFVAAEDGHIYCLDGQGNGDGTTNVIWAYPSIGDTTNPGWTDPNINGAGAPDGTGNVTLAEMPTGFGKSSPLVQRIGGVDYLFIAASNGRVYCLDVAGRGDYNFATQTPGTTTRQWSYPNDYPQGRRAGSLGSFSNTSIAYAEIGGVPRLYVPTESGHLYALNPVGNAGTRTTNVLWDFPGRTSQLAPITSVPAIMDTAIGTRIFFGTTIDDDGIGHFYSVDAATGSAATAQEFIPAVGEPVLRGFFGGPAAVDAITIGGGAPDTVFVANNNLNVYALDAANINNVIWRTSELNTTVAGPLTFTPMMVFDTTGIPGTYPTVVVPGEGGQFSALFARGGLSGNGITNSFGGKFAWGKAASSNIVAGTSVGAPPGAPGFLYGGDTSGNLFAFSNATTIAGQGDPPIQDIIEPDNPDGAAWRNAKLKIIDKATYEALRNDPTVVTHAAIDALVQTPPYAFEWGQTAYFVCYDFPYMETLTGGPAVSPSLVNFQISTEGATNRQFSVVARPFPAGAPAQRDGYAILAFAIQGSGPNSLPPGRGRISYTVTPGRAASDQPQPQVAQNPNQFLEFEVANPIGIDMSPGANDEMAVTTVTNDPGALANGSPNLATTPGNNETLLTTHFGLTGHASAGSTTIRVFDRSWMTFLRGPGRGVDMVRVQRPELAWLGGSAAIWKPIPTAVFGTLFEDLPDDRPNVSLDYPNIRAENVNVTKDPNGQAENPGYSGVFLKPPTTAAGIVLQDEADAPTRLLVPTDFLFEVDVPRFQPPNNFVPWMKSDGATINSGYAGRASVFVDSNNDGQLNRLSGRLEANRGFWLNGSVSVDEQIAVRTPNVDLGSLPGGAGYSPFAPATAGSLFGPWPAGSDYGGVPFGNATPEYVTMFRHFTVENPGNVNLLNLRLAKATNQGANRLSWGIYSSSVDEFGWLDAGVGLWSDIDSVYALTPQVILQKPRVGDRSPSVLQTNPRIRPNPNLDTNGGPWQTLNISGAGNPLFNNIRFGDDPRVAVTLPIGFPVGTYSQVMRVIEDANGDESLALNGNNALETFSDPTFTLSYKARETRLTNDFTRFTAPMSDEPGVIGTAGAAFLHQNLQPTASRVSSGASIGHLVVAWTSSRLGAVATQPTSASANDRYRIYLAGLNGGNYSADPRSDPTNGVADLTGFIRNTNTKWFSASPGTVNGYPGPGYLFPTAAGETIVAGTERYGGPALPVRGQVNAVAGTVSNPATFPTFDMAFVGEAQKQTATGRIAESRLFMTRVSMQANGTPDIEATPYAMPFDIFSQKGRPSIVRLGDLIGTPGAEDMSLIAYSALSTGNSRILLTSFDYAARGNANSGFTEPVAVDFGEGFESVASPSISIRQYTGVETFGALVDLTFTGKLRGRRNSEVFQGRLNFNGMTPVNYPDRVNEVLVPDSEAGTFRAQGIEWDLARGVTLQLMNNLGAIAAIETPGTRRFDQATGIVTIDTSLGGKAYIDSRLGTVRLSTGLPLSTQQLILSYTPKFLRVSVGTTAGYTGSSTFLDSRFEGLRFGPGGVPISTKYWARADNTSIQAGDNPRVNRYFMTYNRAAAGAGQAARPFMKTMRMGIQLPYQIFTDQNGNLLRAPGVPSIQVTQNAGAGGVSSYFQVDPVKGRVYFSGIDEDDQITITFNGVDQSTGQPTGIGGNPNTPFVVTGRVSLITELDETPVPIEQAVNESNMIVFPDPFDSPNFPRPNLVWMFWSSTRGGSPDLYFQTVAPRFAPQASGN